MRKKGKLGGKRAVARKTEEKDDYKLQRSWRESNYERMVGWTQQVDVEGAGVTGETLAFSMERRQC